LPINIASLGSLLLTHPTPMFIQVHVAPSLSSRPCPCSNSDEFLVYFPCPWPDLCSFPPVPAPEKPSGALVASLASPVGQQCHLIMDVLRMWHIC
jgi:hypothetical protein